jgi:hypothetical protein
MAVELRAGVGLTILLYCGAAQAPQDLTAGSVDVLMAALQHDRPPPPAAARIICHRESPEISPKCHFHYLLLGETGNTVIAYYYGVINV